ncbi:hypothetical protein IC582_029609 [Cucumis melo]
MSKILFGLGVPLSSGSYNLILIGLHPKKVGVMEIFATVSGGCGSGRGCQ